MRQKTCHLFLLSVFILLVALAASSQVTTTDRPRLRPAVVIDERLSALRVAPSLAARLLHRISRGRKIYIIEGNGPVTTEGVTFMRVAVTRRTRGWIQTESFVSLNRKGDDERLWQLINASEEFDQIARTKILIDFFPHSPRRVEALLLLGKQAERAASELSQEATRRLDEREMKASGASLRSFFLNYSGLDRYNRLGLNFTFDAATKQYHYDGESWRELLRRYPQSTEAIEARALMTQHKTALD